MLGGVTCRVIHLKSKTFCRVILRLWGSGIVNYMISQAVDSTKQCRVDDKPKTKVQVLKLVDLAAVFVLIGLGLTLSVLVFIFEIIVSYGSRLSLH